MILEAHIPRLDPSPSAAFPDPATCSHPDGLLAWGGDLSPERLIRAYSIGVFPWYEHGAPLLWWSPDPRMIFFPEKFAIARSLRKILRNSTWSITLDLAFQEVMSACAEPRGGQTGTWITPGMQAAYCTLHQHGLAHSLEVWENHELIGGLYGVSLGHVFFAESKFHKRTNASKVALAYLMRLMRRWSFAVVDCQVRNSHLERLGACEIPRTDFISVIESGLSQPPRHPTHQAGDWRDRCTELEIGLGW